MALDRWISEFDSCLRALTGVMQASRPVPQPPRGITPPSLSPQEKAHAAALMRVNHVGEICAQALYQAQKLASHSVQAKSMFEHAAREEQDHLSWTAARIEELGGRLSLLNPVWYAGAFLIGFAAGKMSDRISLGFMAETERQVEQHLNTHLERLPQADEASRAIVAQMRDDEAAHAQAAQQAGGAELPLLAQRLMRAASRVMTSTAYYI